MKKAIIENTDSTLVKRIKAETPDWFKKIRNTAGALAAMATAIKTAIPMLDGFVLPEPIPTILNYCIVAGIAVAAVSQTAKK
jgi:hypothetical protein